MLTNEQTKLQSLYQVAQSEELARQQKIREQAVLDVGTVRAMSTVKY